MCDANREAAIGTELARAVNAGIGAFDRFDRENRAIFDAYALANVETPHLLGDFPTKFDVFVLAGRRGPAGNLSRFHE